ncbi:MAG: PAS domain S-box protein, partial [Deltaproteobacteria bacterium]|nr:PAS domain S-box protein [Deltaproteobacteria bacterium]
NCGLGVNYLELCRGTVGSGAEEAHQVAQGIEALISGRRETFNFEYPCHGPSEKRWFLLRASRFKLRQGVRVILCHVNITEFKRLELKLKHERDRYSQILSALNTGLRLIEADLTVSWVNEQTMKMFPDREIVGKTCHEVFENSTSPCKNCGTRSAMINRVSQFLERYVPEQEKWFSIFSIPILDDDGRVLRVIEGITDITERKHDEIALTQSEARYRSLFEGNAVVMLLIDPENGQLIDANQAAAAFYGWSRETMRQMSIFEINLMPAAEVRQAITDCMHNLKNQFDFKHRLADQRVRDVEVFSGPVRLGERIVLHSNVIDVTARNTAQHKLLQAMAELEKLNFIVNHSPAVAFIWKNEEDWPTEFVSQNITQFGYTAEELCSGATRYTDIVDPRDLDRITSEVKLYASKDADFFAQEYRIIGTNGQPVWVDDQTWIIRDQQGRITHYHGLLWNIDRLKQVERELRLANQRFAQMEHNLRDRLIFFSISRAGIIRYASEGVAKLGKVTKEEAAGLAWEKIADWEPGSMLKLRHQNRRILNRETDHIQYDAAFRGADGELGWLSVYAYIRRDEHDDIFFEGVAIDVSRQRKAEKQRQILEQAIKNARISVVITDAQGNILYVNPFFSQITGYTLEEVLGKNPRILKSGKHDQAFYAGMWAQTSQGETWRSEMINRKKDGTLFWEKVTISPVLDDDNQASYWVAVKDDISDKKEVERLKEDVDRIMRHDLKTPLNGIIGIPQLLEMDDNLTPEQREYLNAIKESGQRMLRMIDSSLDLYKMETKKYDFFPHKVDAIAVLHEIIQDFKAKLSAGSILVRMAAGNESGPDVFPVWADRDLLYTLFANLMANAVEASPDNSEILLDFDHRLPVTIRIHNRGAVPASIRSDFFQKYKSVGKKKGTGLGTYSAKVIADTMGISLAMSTSDEHNCTTITLAWPTMEGS